jgi:acid stress chaperone HdeB
MPARIGGKTRKKIGFASAASAAGLLLALQAIPAARAQVTLDVAKITCGQYTGHKITNSQNIAIWLSGYHHGKRGDPTLDTQRLLADAKKLRDYCFKNSQTPVMEAVEKLFGTDR